MQYIATLNGIGGLAGAIERSAGQLLQTPVVVPSPAEQKDFLFNLFPTDHPFRNRFLTQILTLDEKTRTSLIVALMTGRVQPQDNTYQSYGECVNGSSNIVLIESGQSKDATRNIDGGKLEAYRWFLICEWAFSYGFADNSLLIDNAIFDAIEDTNNAPGVPNLIKMRVPPQIENGNVTFTNDKEKYRDKTPLSGFWSKPYGNSANFQQWYNPKWIFPQIELDMTVQTKGALVVPAGSSAFLKVVLNGIELRVSQTV